MSKTLKPLLLMSILTLGIFVAEREMVANAQVIKNGTVISIILDPKIAKASMSGRVFLVLSKAVAR